MNKIFKASAIAVALFSIVACNETNSASTTADKAVTKTDKAATTFENEDQKSAYAIGVTFANFVTKSIDQASEMGVNTDKELVIKGFSDTLKGGAQLTEEEVKAALVIFEQKMQTAQAAKITETEKAFFDENAKKEGVVTTASGLQYEVVKAGEGEKPTAADTVTVHYTGTLTDGTKFDSSHDRGEPISFPLNGVIAGWTEGLQLMSPGSTYKFTIPSGLGYGARESGPIPANSILLFEVELISVEKMTAPAQEAPTS